MLCVRDFMELYGTLRNASGIPSTGMSGLYTESFRMCQELYNAYGIIKKPYHFLMTLRNAYVKYPEEFRIFYATHTERLRIRIDSVSTIPTNSVCPTQCIRTVWYSGLIPYPLSEWIPYVLIIHAHFLKILINCISSTQMSSVNFFYNSDDSVRYTQALVKIPDKFRMLFIKLRQINSVFFDLQWKWKRVIGIRRRVANYIFHLTMTPTVARQKRKLT